MCTGRCWWLPGRARAEPRCWRAASRTSSRPRPRDPHEILAVTYTRNSAAELIARVAALLYPRQQASL